MRAVVQVVGQRGDERNASLGTAFFITPRMALTAAHVVAGLDPVRLYVEDGDGGYVKLRTVVRVEVCPAYANERTIANDWAILRLSTEDHDAELPLSTHVAPHQPWRSQGFAAAVGTTPTRAAMTMPVSLSGTVTDVDGYLHLHCLQGADGSFVLGGASGSPIIVEEKVVGILQGGLRGDVGGTRGGVVHATPLPVEALKQRGVMVEAPARAQHLLLLSPTPRFDLSVMRAHAQGAEEIEAFTALAAAKPIEIAGPAEPDWHRCHRPDAPMWRAAVDAIDAKVPELKAVDGDLHVFASTNFALGAVLGLRLANVPGAVNVVYWQAEGLKGAQRWVRLGRARDSKLYGLMETAAARPGWPVALSVSITGQIASSAIDRSLARAGVSGAQHIAARAYKLGHAAVADASLARKVAHDLMSLFSRLDAQSERAPLHVFYYGPLAVLMMAAGALTALGPVTVYAWYEDEQIYLPAVHIHASQITLPMAAR